MKKTLFIHIGWHKTGSTFIQLYLNKHRSFLKKNNICYPFIDKRSKYGNVKHVDLCFSIVSELLQEQFLLEVKPFNDLFEQSIKEFEKSACRYNILSEEGFSIERQGISKLLSRYKQYFDEVIILAFVRRQDFFLESYYSQWVRQDLTREKGTISQFIQGQKIRERADYSLVLDWWAEEFGAENIRILPYEKHVIQPEPVTCFFKLANLPLDILERKGVENRKTNTTPPREISELYRLMNSNGIDYDPRGIANIIDKNELPLTNTRFLSKSDRLSLLRDYEESNKQVAEKYLKKSDGILFEEPVVEYENCPVTWNGFNYEDLQTFLLPTIALMSMDVPLLKISKIHIPDGILRWLKQLKYKYT